MLRIIQTWQNTTGLEVNLGKTVLYCPAGFTEDELTKAREAGVQTSTAGITLKTSANGVEVLGAPVGDEVFVQEYATKKIDGLTGGWKHSTDSR